MGRRKMTDLEKQLKQQLRDMQRDDLRAYEILFIIWEPLCYEENFLSKLSEMGVPMFVGPVHDSDLLPDGSTKKAHRHCGAKYKTKKYLDTFYDELKEIFGKVSDTVIDVVSGEVKPVSGESCYCISFPQKVKGTFSGAVRYTKHLDNPDKVHYKDDPVGLCGLDPYEFLLTSSDETSLILQINSFITDNHLHYPGEFLLLAAAEGHSEYVSIYTRKKTYLINSILDGVRRYDDAHFKRFQDRSHD